MSQSGQTCAAGPRNIIYPWASQPNGADFDGEDRQTQLRSHTELGSMRSHRPSPAKRVSIGEGKAEGGDEDLPSRKRKVTFPARRQTGTRRQLNLPSKHRPRATRKHNRASTGTLASSTGEEAGLAAIVSYEEWPLSDVLLSWPFIASGCRGLVLVAASKQDRAFDGRTRAYAFSLTGNAG